MSEEAGLEAFETTLDHAVKKMQVLEARLRTGEEVSQEEVDAIAKQVANELEEALDVLKSMLGTEDEPPLEEDASWSLEPAPQWMAILDEAEPPRLKTGEAGAL